MTSTEKTPKPLDQLAATSGTEPALAVASPGSTQAHSGEPEATSLDALVNVVLDSAGVANRSASIAASSTESLLAAVGDLGKATSRARMTSAVVLGVSALSIVTTAGALFAVSVQLSGRLTQTNATLLAVGKRAVEMNTGIENLKRIETVLAGIANKQGPEQSQKLEAKLDAALAETRKPTAAAATENTAKQDDARHQSLLTQIKALEAQTQAQGRSITRMNELISASRAEVSKTLGVARSLEILLTNFNEKPRLAATGQTPPVAREREPIAREREKPTEQKSKDFIQYPAPQADRAGKPRQTPASADAAAATQ